MKRSVFYVLVLLFSALAIPLAGSPASAAPATPAPETEYWFGNLEFDHMLLGGSSAYTTAYLRHPDKTHAFPFRSTLKATLYNCKGKKARTVWGNSESIKRKGQPWHTDLSVSLNTPKRGKYEKWVLTVRSKGKKTTRITVDGYVGPFLTLGCKGRTKYKRDKRTSYSPRWDAGRPLNAAFGKSTSKALKKHIKSFGKMRGTAKVGRDVWLAGARTTKGRPDCGMHLAYAWPARPKMGLAETGQGCDTKHRIPQWSWYRSPQGKDVRARTKGKRLTVGSYFYYRGHGYKKEFDLGKVK